MQVLIDKFIPGHEHYVSSLERHVSSGGGYETIRPLHIDNFALSGQKLKGRESDQTFTAG
jgi:hypothetical protein